MRIRKRTMRSIVGVLLIALAMGGMVYWEKGGREALTYADVLVLRESVQPGTIIKKDMLGTIKMDKDLLLQERVSDYNTIIGLAAKCYIPAMLQLSQNFFQEEGLTIEKNQYVCAIPEEWIKTYPQTLRRGDTVYFYEVSASADLPVENIGSSILSAKVAYVKDSTNREVVDVTAERMDGSAEAAHIEIIIDDVQFDLLRRSAESGHQFVLAYE